MLLDWAWTGEGYACHELAWYLALNRARLPLGHSKESTIDDFRAALERHGVTTAGWFDRQLGALSARRARPVRLGEGARRRQRARMVVRACPRRRGASVTTRHSDPRDGVADAYSAAGEAWHDGPTRIYDVMAREQLASARVALDDAVVLDLGAGTGAASRAAAGAGARSIIAVDVAAGMLLVGRDQRPPAVLGDALQLPFADGVFDTVVAAFSLNHLDDPVAALGEASRVTHGGGWVLSSSYAADDSHPVKGIVDEAAARWGWNPGEWYRWVHAQAVPRLATADRVRDAAAAAGLTEIAVEPRSVTFADFGPVEMVRWRLGMPQLAGFLAGLEPRDAAHARGGGDRRPRLGPAGPRALGAVPDGAGLYTSTMIASNCRGCRRRVRRHESIRPLVAGALRPRIDVEMPAEIRRQPPRLERRAPAEPFDRRADRIEVVRPTGQRDDGLGEHDIAERSPLPGVGDDVGRQPHRALTITVGERQPCPQQTQPVTLMPRHRALPVADRFHPAEQLSGTGGITNGQTTLRQVEMSDPVGLDQGVGRRLTIRTRRVIERGLVRLVGRTGEVGIAQ